MWQIFGLKVVKTDFRLNVTRNQSLGIGIPENEESYVPRIKSSCIWE